MGTVLAWLGAETGRRRRWRDHLAMVGHVLLLSAALRVVVRWLVGDRIVALALPLSVIAWLAYLVVGKAWWYGIERPRRLARGEAHAPLRSRAAWRDIAGDAIITALVPVLASVSRSVYDAPVLLTWAVAYYATQRRRWTD